ncbi:MAG: NAD-dependent epimerase/dehydratase family protein [Candidatus Viridilinea halotolerans]|uniref:NAD-dependent epimerase/dehydratase family protein n=1 Tax=Candidatus Viridilinea halotolerans TaxID=2491704 RepID=A0A426TZX7_9CHLR|nr:MAG: NAD-dependent epimerase/dehydratase family protein [Candidatus Viridilinea halotolerans]
MSRLLITGGTGYLGSVLVRQSAALGYNVVATYFTQAPPTLAGVTWLPLDVRDPHAVAATLASTRPDRVIHTAFQQSGPDLLSITAHGAGHVAAAAARVQARLIHLSSDVIFDGEAQRAYTEDDPPAPISAYGHAKAQAEALVAAAHPSAVSVRTSLIYGFAPPDRISRFTLDVASGKIVAQLFTDEYRCPIYVEDLAAALLELSSTNYQGILNIAGADRVSRYQLGTLIARAWGQDPSSIPAGLSASQSPPRPRNCTLNIARAQALLSTPLRGIHAVLRDHGRLLDGG